MLRAIGISSVFIALTAIGGTLSYIVFGWGINPIPYSMGYISLLNFLVICIFSVPMAKVGAKYAYVIPEKYLKILFGIGIIYIELKMLNIV